MRKNLLEILFIELHEFLQPLLKTEGDPEQILEFFHRSGWNMSKLMQGREQEFLDKVNAVITSSGSLAVVIKKPPKTFSELKKSIKSLEPLFSAIWDLQKVLSGFDFPAAKALPADLINGLSLIYLFNKSEFLFKLLELVTTIQYETQALSIVEGEVVRDPNLLPRLRLSRLGRLIDQPEVLMREEYWPQGLKDLETAKEVAEKLFPRIAGVLEALEFNAFHGRGAGSAEFPPWFEAWLKAMMTFSREITIEESGDIAEFGMTIGLIPEDQGGPGLLCIPYGALEIKTKIPGWRFELNQAGAGQGFQITRKGFSAFGDARMPSIQGRLSLLKLPQEKEGAVIRFGDAKGTRLEVRGLGLSASYYAEQGFREAKIMCLLEGFQVVLARQEGDGFLQKLMPEGGLSVETDLAVGWSSRDGFHIQGSGGMGTVIPIHKSLGPVRMNTAQINLAINQEGVRLDTGLSFTAALGPVTFSIENVGLSGGIEFAEQGNFGPINLVAPDFKGASGIGMAIDAKVVSGSGFLRFNHAQRLYTGFLSLSFKKLELSAIGILSTRMASGKAGFSMLILINTAFKPPLQLSFGFTLNGVGGLFGINRSMNRSALQERFRSGAINTLMFPHDPVRNFDSITSNLQAVFPPVERHFVFAPLFKLGWGTPSLMEIDLGLLIETPFHGRFLLLGALRINMPTQKNKLVRINVDVLGDFNFAQQYLLLEGRIRDSQIVGVSLSGGFAFLLAWERKPQFLFSIGGYHPRYKKPARFPEIPRLRAVINIAKTVQLTCEYYQAITSNSLQIGFEAGLKINWWIVSMEGELRFHTLLQWSPFYFDVDVTIGMKVKVRGKTLLGIQVAFALSGPAPWRAKGYARIKVFWFLKIKVNFDVSWGRQRVQMPEYMDSFEIFDRLVEQLRADQSWSSRLLSNRDTAELLQLPDGERLLLHPAGRLEVRQMVTPLDKLVDKYGNATLSSKTIFRVSKVSLGGVAIPPGSRQNLREYFARGQYEALSKEEQLSTPDFELMNAGLSFQVEDEGIDLSDDLLFSIPDYENIILRADIGAERGNRDIVDVPGWMEQSLALKQVARRRVPEDDSKEYGAAAEPLLFAPEQGYLIVDRDHLTPIDLEEGNFFETHAEASDYLKIHLPEQLNELQILPAEVLETATI